MAAYMIGTMAYTLIGVVSRLSTVQFHAVAVRAKTAPGANMCYRLIPTGMKIAAPRHSSPMRAIEESIW